MRRIYANFRGLLSVGQQLRATRPEGYLKKGGTSNSGPPVTAIGGPVDSCSRAFRPVRTPAHTGPLENSRPRIQALDSIALARFPRIFFLAQPMLALRWPNLASFHFSEFLSGLVLVLKRCVFPSGVLPGFPLPRNPGASDSPYPQSSLPLLES